MKIVPVSQITKTDPQLPLWISLCPQSSKLNKHVPTAPFCSSVLSGPFPALHRSHAHLMPELQKWQFRKPLYNLAWSIYQFWHAPSLPNHYQSPSFHGYPFRAPPEKWLKRNYLSMRVRHRRSKQHNLGALIAYWPYTAWDTPFHPTNQGIWFDLVAHTQLYYPLSRHQSQVAHTPHPSTAPLQYWHTNHQRGKNVRSDLFDCRSLQKFTFSPVIVAIVTLYDMLFPFWKVEASGELSLTAGRPTWRTCHWKKMGYAITWSRFRSHRLSLMSFEEPIEILRRYSLHYAFAFRRWNK